VEKGKQKKPGRGKKDGRKAALRYPAVLRPDVDAEPLRTDHGTFDLDNPVLPDWVAAAAFGSGGYPYDEPLDGKAYEKDLRTLQIELVKLQKWTAGNGKRIAVAFEGRDAAGKDGAIAAIKENLNPRSARAVALPKPTDTERSQWYFQRYVKELPSAGEIVLFDRSWYNRGGVESVMGFCTPSEHRLFLRQAPDFEALLIEQGIVLIKYWLEIGREMQLQRFHERRHNPLRIWKLSAIDYAALTRWDAYTAARDDVLDATHTPTTPWVVVKSNDKKRARLAILRHLLGQFAYDGKEEEQIGQADRQILGLGPALLVGKPA